MIAYLLPLAVSIAVTLPAAQVESAPVLFARGMQALQAGQLPEAERCFVQVTKQDPASAAAFVNLGVVFMRGKRWPEALRALKEAESLSLELPGIHLNLGLVYYRSGDFGKAVPEFRLAHGAQAEYLLGLSCFFSDQYGCATEALEPLWESHTSDLTYLYVLGSAAGRSKQESLETKAFQQMAVAGGDTPLFHLYKGKALIGKQVYGEAVSELQIASGAKPPLPMSHYYLAEAYQGEHNEEAARSELLEEIRLEPEVAYSYDQLGHVCELLGLGEEAERAYLSAVARDPSLSTSYMGLAALYKSRKRYEEALAMVDRALKIQPNSGSIHYQRARLLSLERRDIEAKAEFVKSSTLLREFNDETQRTHDSARQADMQQIKDAAQL